MFVFVIDFTMFEPFISHSLETWELSFTKANNYRDLGGPLVPMIACMIRSKASVSHDLIQAEVGATSKFIEAWFQLMCKNPTALGAP